MANQPDVVLHSLRARAEKTPNQLLSVDDVKRLHAEHVERAKTIPEADAKQMTRTEVHGILQLLQPAPARLPNEPPDDHAHRQKGYGRELWKAADILITQAGIS